LTSNFSPPLSVNTFFLEVHVEPGEMPCRSASASTNGLNEEPGCRWPCVARLNEDLA
jgi:hypothetical protein